MKTTFFQEIYQSLHCKKTEDLVKIIKYGFPLAHKPAQDFLMPFAENPNENNYLISDNLGEALDQCSIDIPSFCLAGDRQLYIRFPDFVSKRWQGAFCKVEGNTFSILLAGRVNILATGFAKLSYDLSGHANLESCLNKAKEHPRFDDDFCHCAIFAAKCLLYIRSGDPDLRIWKSPELPKTRKEKKIRTFLKTHHMFDVVMVGLDYKKPTNHSKDQTTVPGHYRWQRIGKGLSDIKLTWVKQHPRILNREEAA